MEETINSKLTIAGTDITIQDLMDASWTYGDNWNDCNEPQGMDENGQPVVVPASWYKYEIAEIKGKQVIVQCTDCEGDSICIDGAYHEQVSVIDEDGDEVWYDLDDIVDDIIEITGDNLRNYDDLVERWKDECDPERIAMHKAEEFEECDDDRYEYVDSDEADTENDSKWWRVTIYRDKTDGSLWSMCRGGAMSPYARTLEDGWTAPGAYMYPMTEDDYEDWRREAGKSVA